MHDDSGIAEEDDTDTGSEREPKSLSDELQDRIEDAREYAESSWADIKAEEVQEAQDNEDREEEVEQLKQSLYPSRVSASQSSNPKDLSPAPSDRQSQRSSSIPSISGSSEQGRSLSPALSRQTTQTSDRSPRKSKIPQPAKASSQSRSRSPIKQKSSSIPRPMSQGPSRALSGSSSTNGTTTKHQPASTKDTGGASSDRPHSVQSVHEEEDMDTNVKQDTEHQRSDSDSVPTTTSASVTSSTRDSASLPPEEEPQQGVGERNGNVTMSGEAGAELEFLSRRNKGETAEESQGLSTTDPAEEGMTFAEKVKDVDTH